MDGSILLDGETLVDGLMLLDGETLVDGFILLDGETLTEGERLVVPEAMGAVIIIGASVGANDAEGL